MAKRKTTTRKKAEAKAVVPEPTAKAKPVKAKVFTYSTGEDQHRVKDTATIQIQTTGGRVTVFHDNMAHSCPWDKLSIGGEFAPSYAGFHQWFVSKLTEG